VTYKIVHITTVHAPFDQRIFHRECYSLAQAGYQVTLLAHADNDTIKDNVRIRSLGKPYRGQARLRLGDRKKRVMNALSAALELDADVYHIHDPELISIALTLKQKSKARVIYDAHEDNIGFMLQKRHLPALMRPILAMIVGFYELRAARTLDAVVTADEGVRIRFQRLGAAQTETIYNFPRLELFTAKHVPTQKFDLVYHGTVPRYHLEVCFEVDRILLKQGYQLRWLFLGRILDPAWAKQQIELLGDSDRIVLEEQVPHEAVAEKVLRARIGIIPLPDLPKFHHNIPTKLFEYMALGMPVILSDLPPSRPFVQSGNFAISVSPNNPYEYAQAIRQLIASPDLRNQMGKEGRRLVESRYNWDAEVAKLLSLYGKLLCQDSSL